MPKRVCTPHIAFVSRQSARDLFLARILDASYSGLAWRIFEMGQGESEKEGEMGVETIGAVVIRTK